VLWCGRTRTIIDIAFEQCNKKDTEEIGLIIFNNEPIPYIIGYAHLMFSNKPSRSHSCSFGMVIHQKYQRQGWGQLLLKDTIRFAQQIGKEKIWLHVYAFNKPAIKLYKKHGFKKEGAFKKEEYKNGHYVDVLSLAKFI